MHKNEKEILMNRIENTEFYELIELPSYAEKALSDAYFTGALRVNIG